MLYYLPLTHFILTFGKLEQREQVRKEEGGQCEEIVPI